MSDTFDHEGDAWTSLIDSEDRDDEPPEYFGPRPQTCRRCGMTHLWWVKQPEGWRLVKDGKAHRCLTTTAAVDFKKGLV